MFSEQFEGQFEARKRDHLRHALDPAHQAAGMNGLDRIHLFHDALPELDFEEVRIETPCVGRPLATPFFVAGMTAGHADAPALNRVLALACQERGWALGVGSQRRELEQESSVDSWRALRDQTPTLTVFANLGASQLVGAPLTRVRRLVDAVSASALVVHANALQEALQPEGTPRFRGVVEALRNVCAEIGVPVVLKETGCGFSRATLARLQGVGLAALDVSGLGGTHWGRIEGARSRAGSPLREASRTFAHWGETTVDSVLAAREALPETEIWASGGVRTGLDAAKLLALGAKRVGFAQPALEAALAGPEALREWMAARETELKTALFCTGSATASEMGTKWTRVS